MKREPSIAARSLRAVGLAITLVSIVTLSTVAYTAVADFQTFVDQLRSGSSSVISGSAAMQGSTLVLQLNVTAKNSGLYPISISLSCSPAQPDAATCTGAQTTIAPGAESTLHFRMSVPNGTQYLSGSKPLHVNGSVTVELEPFATFTDVQDFGNLFRIGGA